MALPNPAAGRNLVASMGTPSLGDTSPLTFTTLGLTPRQQDLDVLWARYRTQHYDTWKIDFEGRQVVEAAERDAIAHQGYVPAGFMRASQDFPAKFRKPTAPYNLYKVIVDRFTGLLFGTTHRPRFSVPGDPDAEQYVQSIVDSVRLWARMTQVRSFGGATGTAVIGAKLIEGKPRLEVFDPRWCFPVFSDRETLELSRLEIRYVFPKIVPDPDTGGPIEKPFVYRRVINDVADVIYYEAAVPDDGTEPQWVEKQWAVHNLGFCPVVWIQNLPMDGEIDGDNDCLGIEDTVHEYDTVMSKVGRTVKANCDPTVVITTAATLTDIKLGSDNALKLPLGSDVKYLETALAGATAGKDYAQTLRLRALEMAQCVLDQDTTDVQKTATEVSRSYSSMLEKADVLREQYGVQGLQRWMVMMLRIILHVTRPDQRDPVTGNPIPPQTVRLPPIIKERTDDVGNKIIDRLPNLPPKTLEASLDLITVVWPNYYSPTMQDVTAAVTAITAAVDAGLVDKQHAHQFIAPYLKIDDVEAMRERLEEDEEAEAEKAAGTAPPDPNAPPAVPGAVPPGMKPNPAKPPALAVVGAQPKAVGGAVAGAGGQPPAPRPPPPGNN